MEAWAKSIPGRGTAGAKAMGRSVPGGYGEWQRSQFVRALVFTARVSGGPAT